MNVLHKIVIAGVDCLAPGGGGSPEFYKRQIEIMPDLDRATFANLLKSKMPELTEKFQKIKQYEAWFQTMLVEHRWYSKIRKDELRDLCQVGVNDSNVTLSRLERNLHNVLKRCVPGWKLVSKWDGKEHVEYYLLGELDAARATFLDLYPNATWPEVDEEALAKRREAEAEAAKVEAEEEAQYRRSRETFEEVRHWDKESDRALCLAETSLEACKANRRGSGLQEAQHEYDLAKAEDDRCRAAKNARQQVQMKRLKDGLPVYGPDEGPELLVRGDQPGVNLGST